MDHVYFNGERSCFSDTSPKGETAFSSVVAVVRPSDRSSRMVAATEDPQKSELLGPTDHKFFHICFSSLELLGKYEWSNNYFIKETADKKRISKGIVPTEGGRILSTEEIVRVAASCFIHKEGDPSAFTDTRSLHLSGITFQEINSINLITLLLSAADSLSNRQYGRASNLIAQCFGLSSRTGNPLERLVYYFSDALQEKIDRETGKSSSKGVIRERCIPPPTNHIQKRLPFSQLLHIISMQTILENLGSAKRIHMIDTSIRHGSQWAVLMQALARRSTGATQGQQHLKISAIGTSEEEILSTGKRLVSLAQSLNLPFSFKAVVVTDMKDLTENMFGVMEGEALGVYSSMDLSLLIATPHALENLMRVIRKLKPLIMIVSDVESKSNSPSFIKRFTEVLFYSSSLFDYLDGFMSSHDLSRMIIEGDFISQGIRGILAREGSERVVRHVGINVWRAFFDRFGFAEAELSEWSVYQARILMKGFAGGTSCMLQKNGRSMMLGWKGTPLVFISAWRVVFENRKIASSSQVLISQDRYE